MARVPQIHDALLVEPSQRYVFEEIAGSRGRISAPYSVMMNAPEAVLHTARLSLYLRDHSLIPKDLWELAVITTAKFWESDVEWAGHSKNAVSQGIPQAVVDAVATNASTDGLAPDHALIINFTRAILQKHKVPQPLFDGIHKKWGDRGSIELITLIGFYSMIAVVLESCEVKPAPGGRG